jgi:hypothetical protein
MHDTLPFDPPLSALGESGPEFTTLPIIAIINISRLLARKKKDRLAAVSPKSDQVFFDQVTAELSRFLRQPSRLNRPRPVAKSGRTRTKITAEVLRCP